MHSVFTTCVKYLPRVLLLYLHGGLLEALLGSGELEDQDIGALEVIVDHLVLVEVGETSSHLEGEGGREGEREGGGEGGREGGRGRGRGGRGGRGGRDGGEGERRRGEGEGGGRREREREGGEGGSRHPQGLKWLKDLSMQYMCVGLTCIAACCRM